MQSFEQACAGQCKYDIVAFHYYGTDANDLIAYAKVSTKPPSRSSNRDT